MARGTLTCRVQRRPSPTSTFFGIHIISNSSYCQGDLIFQVQLILLRYNDSYSYYCTIRAKCSCHIRKRTCLVVWLFLIWCEGALTGGTHSWEYHFSASALDRFRCRHVNIVVWPHQRMKFVFLSSFDCCLRLWWNSHTYDQSLRTHNVLLMPPDSKPFRATGKQKIIIISMAGQSQMKFYKDIFPVSTERMPSMTTRSGLPVQQFSTCNEMLDFIISTTL